jgi:hypothetical protein
VFRGWLAGTANRRLVRFLERILPVTMQTHELDAVNQA